MFWNTQTFLYTKTTSMYKETIEYTAASGYTKTAFLYTKTIFFFWLAHGRWSLRTNSTNWNLFVMDPSRLSWLQKQTSWFKFRTFFVWKALYYAFCIDFIIYLSHKYIFSIDKCLISFHLRWRPYSGFITNKPHFLNFFKIHEQHLYTCTLV